jgi:hypothetical protein
LDRIDMAISGLFGDVTLAVTRCLARKLLERSETRF